LVVCRALLRAHRECVIGLFWVYVGLFWVYVGLFWVSLFGRLCGIIKGSPECFMECYYMMCLRALLSISRGVVVFHGVIKGSAEYFMGCLSIS